jgi:hypothetical protein
MRVKQFLLGSFLVFTFSSCKSEKSGEINIPNCKDGEYQALVSGDKIQKLSNSARIKIIHGADNSKKVCIVNGEAKVSKR